MTLLILSFLAGVLTTAAPCILPLLPVIVGGSVMDKEHDSSTSRPLIIAGSLALSVVLFTLLLKVTTALLGVPPMAWQFVSGGIVIALGLHFLIPGLWERMPLVARLNSGSNRLLGKSYKQKGVLSAVLIGASLGPVFSSCSPTYALVVASVLPESFLRGLAYLAAYALGLAGTLLVISYVGQGFIRKLGWLANPSGWFHRVVGIIFIVVGLSVLFGIDKKLQTYVLDQGWYGPIERLEQRLR